MGNTKAKLLTKEQLMNMHGKTVILGFKGSELMPTLDGDVFWLDPEVYLEVDGKIYSAITHGESSPIILDGDPVDGEHKITIVNTSYICQVSNKAGLFWGENNIYSHQYVFYTSSEKVYYVNTPLYHS